MPIAEINNAKFYYELHGDGSPVVLISGLKGDHSIWIPIVAELSKQHQLLLFDNRGVGRTVDSGQPFTVETMAEDTINLINKLNLNKPHIIGHSLGGSIAQNIAQKYPQHISSITLCNAFSKFSGVGKTILTNVLKMHQDNLSPTAIMNYIAPWVFSEAFLNEEMLELILNTVRENTHHQSASGYERQLDALYNFDSIEWIKSINVPTLIVGSRDDKLVRVEESQLLCDSIVSSKLAITSGGHAIQAEQPGFLIEHVLNFYGNLK